MTNWIERMIAEGGYLGLFFLMLAETIFPPIPSEVIMSMAGLQASKGTMALLPAILAGSGGAMLGNLLWYAVARGLGMRRLQPLIERHGRWLTVDWAEVVKAERWFVRHGRLFVCIGRMLPTLRSLVSIPAGLMKMGLMPFLLCSSIGTTGWTAMLASGGWLLGSRFAELEAWLGLLSSILLTAITFAYVWRLCRWRPGR